MYQHVISSYIYPIPWYSLSYNQPGTTAPLSLLHRLPGPVTRLHWDVLASVYLQISRGILSGAAAAKKDINVELSETPFFFSAVAVQGDWQKRPATKRFLYGFFCTLWIPGWVIRFSDLSLRHELVIDLRFECFWHFNRLSTCDWAWAPSIQWNWLVTCESATPIWKTRHC